MCAKRKPSDTHRYLDVYRHSTVRKLQIRCAPASQTNSFYPLSLHFSSSSSPSIVIIPAISRPTLYTLQSNQSILVRPNRICRPCNFRSLYLLLNTRSMERRIPFIRQKTISTISFLTTICLFIIRTIQILISSYNEYIYYIEKLNIIQISNTSLKVLKY